VTPVPHLIRRRLTALHYVGASRFSAASLLRPGPDTQPPPVVSRLAHLTASALLAGIAVELLVEARLGLTPFDGLAYGLGHGWGLSLGQSGWLLAGVLYAVAAALGRRPTVWSVLFIFLCGLTIDASAGLLAPTDAIGSRVAFLAGGIVLMAACVGVIVNSDVGGGPAELLMLAGNDRGLSMRTGRMVFDLGIVVGAVAVGGPIGLGTLVYAAAMGPTIQVVNQAFADHQAGRRQRQAEQPRLPTPV
jgi:uncharacterized membrane protein YczE